MGFWRGIEKAFIGFPITLNHQIHVSAIPYIRVVTTKKRRLLIKLLPCLGCAEIWTLRTIFYGMPDPEDLDFEKYAVGSCRMNADGSDPDIRCTVCDWSGIRDQQFS